jgi:hypothetical protein
MDREGAIRIFFIVEYMIKNTIIRKLCIFNRYTRVDSNAVVLSDFLIIAAHAYND